ncbi:SflA family class IV lanthipeptide, partial [Kitasatospora sp. NPDC058063]
MTDIRDAGLLDIDEDAIVFED